MRAFAIGILAIFIAWNHGKQAQPQTGDVQRASQNAPPETAAFAQAASAKQEETRYQKTKAYLKKAFGPEFLASWILVLAAGLGIYATFRTLGILSQQTAATKDSADAALLNAQAVINSERAWLDGEFQVPSGGQDVWDVWGTWNLVAKNHGATPAQLVSHECSFHAEGKELGWDSYDKKDTHNWGTLLGAGQCSEPLQVIKPDSFFALLREQGKRGAAGCTIGVVLTYKDVINSDVEHTTRFLMVYNRMSKTVSRLSQYNAYS